MVAYSLSRFYESRIDICQRRTEGVVPSKYIFHQRVGLIRDSRDARGTNHFDELHGRNDFAYVSFSSHLS